MSDPARLSSEIIYNRLKNELDKQKETLHFRQSEIVQLKHELFENKDTSLHTQKATAVTHMQTKENDLKIRLKSIEALEINILDMENMAIKITIEIEEAKAKMLKKKDELRNGIKEFYRIEKLLEEIELEIANETNKYNKQIENIEMRHQEILNDPNLTLEEKNKLLKTLDKELEQIKLTESSELKVLMEEKNKLQKQSQDHSANLIKIRDDINAKRMKQIQDLENLKIGADPETIAEINAQILALQKTMEDDIKMLDATIQTSFNNKTDGINIENELNKYEVGNNNIEGNSNAVKTYHAMGKDTDSMKAFEKEFGLIDDTISKTTIEKQQIDDQIYLKNTLGVPLKLALAAMTKSQPASPIQFLAQYLLQYRYNEIINCKNQENLQCLIQEREKIQKDLQKRKSKKIIENLCNPCRHFNTLIEEDQLNNNN